LTNNTESSFQDTGSDFGGISIVSKKVPLRLLNRFKKTISVLLTIVLMFSLLQMTAFSYYSEASSDNLTVITDDLPEYPADNTDSYPPGGYSNAPEDEDDAGYSAATADITAIETLISIAIYEADKLVGDGSDSIEAIDTAKAAYDEAYNAVSMFAESDVYDDYTYEVDHWKNALANVRIIIDAARAALGSTDDILMSMTTTETMQTIAFLSAVPYLSFEGDWETIEPDVIGRIESTFDAVWQDIITFYGDGTRFPVIIVLGNTNVVLPDAEGNTTPGYGRVGVTAASISDANQYNTDIIIPGLIQLAQGGPYPTPDGTGVFPAWIAEGLRTFGRVHFGQYVGQGTWVPPAATTDPLTAASGAQLFLFIAQHFDNASPMTGLEAIRDMAQHARLGIYPLRRGGLNMATWVCDDLRSNFFYDRIGISLEEAWELFRGEIPPENEGYMTLELALDGHTLVHGHTFHSGPPTGVPSGEGPENLFNDNQNQKFVSTQAQLGNFWVEWSYPEPFVATRFIWQNANDNHGNAGQDFRRMNTGWTLSGSNDAINWTVLYTGDRDDTGPFNFRFYGADLPGNTTAYQYYRLWSPAPAMGNVIQLASVRLASATWTCDHIFAPVVTPATCGAEGFTTMICTICDEEDPATPPFDITPIDPNARHTGSGNFNVGSFMQAPRPATTLHGARWGEWDWVNPPNPAHRHNPGPGIAAMGFDPDLWWFEQCTTCGVYVPVSDIYHTFLDPPQANRLPWSTVDSWTDIRERDGLGSGAMMDRFVHTFNTVWVPISLFMFDDSITNPDHVPGTINPVTFVLDAGANSIAWASGLQSGVGHRWLRAQPWDTDAMTHELIHNAQLYSNVPLHVFESSADFLREYFGLFNDQADWRNPPMLLYEPGSPHYTHGFQQGYRVGAAFWCWIDRYYFRTVRQRTGVNFIHFSQAMNATVKQEGRYFADHRQYVWLTGYTPHELWAKFMAYEHARYATVTAGWAPGYYTLEAALDGRILRYDAIFTATPGVFVADHPNFSSPNNAGFGSWHNRQAYNLFDRRLGPQGAASGADFDPNGGQRGRYTASGWAQTTNGTAFQVVTTTDDFWVEWRYDEAFIACSFIFATHDNLSLPRRMGDGWTVSGSNDGTTWHVLYRGLASDYANFNNRFYRVDFEDNFSAFSHYRLEAPRGADSAAIQLSVIYLTELRMAPPPDPIHAITILNGGVGASANPNPAFVGETVTLHPGTPPTGHSFVNWTTTTPGVNITNPTSVALASFQMIDAPVVVTANWMPIPITQTTPVTDVTGVSGLGTWRSGHRTQTSQGGPIITILNQTVQQLDSSITVQAQTRRIANARYFSKELRGPDGITLYSDRVWVYNDNFEFTLNLPDDLRLGRHSLTSILRYNGREIARRAFTLEVTESGMTVIEEEPPELVQLPQIPAQPGFGTIIRLAIGQLSYTVNNIPHMMEVAPFIDPSHDRTMVPLGVVAEGLGARVEWNHETRTVTIVLDDVVLLLPVDEPLPDGMGVPMTVDDRTFVPIAYVTQMLGADIRWDGVARAVYIYAG